MARYEIEEMVLNGDTYEFRDNTAQEELVSGTNIKTINNESLLGSGNLVIGGGGTTDYDQLSNRPEINSQVLTGDLSSKDLGLFNIPTYTGDFTDIVTDSGVTFCIVRIPIFVPPTSTSIYIPINIGKPILFPSGGIDYRIRIITEASVYNYSVYINGVAVSSSQATLSSGTYLAKIDTANSRIYFNTGGTIPDVQTELTSGTTIKTINGSSVLGSGNLTTPDTDTDFFVQKGTEIPDSSDLNDYKTLGEYYGTNPSSLSNCPVTGGNIFIKVMETPLGLQQWLYSTSNIYTYVRRYTTSSDTWASWYRNNLTSRSTNNLDLGTVKIDGDLDMSAVTWTTFTRPFFRRPLPTSNDLNDCTQMGLYYVGTGSGSGATANLPTAYAGYAVVFEATDNACVQFYFRLTNSNRVVYSRRRNSGTWGTWGSITFTAL